MFEHDWNLGYREPRGHGVCSISLGDLNPLKLIGSGIKPLTNKIGVTNAEPQNLSQGADVQAQRELAAKLRAEHDAAGKNIAPVLDQAQANQDRGVGEQNIQQLQGVANGTTPTAADALLTKGNDAAARDAAGMAAAYSRGNPGLALRAGLATGSQDYAKAAADAAALKANEQQTARSDIGNFSTALRTADLNAGEANQTAQVNTTGQNIQQQLGTGAQEISGTAAPVSSDYASQAAALQNQASNQQGVGSLMTAGGAIAKASDKRVKDNIAPVSLADSLAKNVHGVSFSYKGGTPEAGSKHVGVLAQDLEKAVPGVVSAGPDGVKKVDTGHLSLANTGVISELAKRLRELEGKKGDDAGVKWGPPVYAREPAPKPITMRDAR